MGLESVQMSKEEVGAARRGSSSGGIQRGAVPFSHDVTAETGQIRGRNAAEHVIFASIARARRPPNRRRDGGIAAPDAGSHAPQARS